MIATCLQRWAQQGSWSSEPVSWAFFSAHFALAALEAEVLAMASWLGKALFTSAVRNDLLLVKRGPRPPSLKMTGWALLWISQIVENSGILSFSFTGLMTDRC